jgi:hypothetical protein
MAAAADRLAALPGSPLASAMTHLRAAADALGAVDWEDEHVEVIGDAVLALQGIRTDLDLAIIDGLGVFDVRDGSALHGSVNTTTWLLRRTNLPYGQAKALTLAARRLEALPHLRAAVEAGDLGMAHVQAITGHLTGAHAPAIAACDAELVELALDQRSLTALNRHLALIKDQFGRDGSEPDGNSEPDHAAGRHPDRRLHLSPGFGGVGELDARLDPIVRELLANALDAFDTPDPAGTPPEERRTAAQRRHDALAAMTRAALDTPGRSGVQGVNAHCLIVANLFDLLGIDPTDPDARRAVGQLLDALGIAIPDLDTVLDALTGSGADGEDAACRRPDATHAEPDAARPEPHAANPQPGAAHPQPGPGLHGRARLGSGQPLPRAHLDELLADATARIVLTLGPFHVAAVGAAHRTVPLFQRPVLLAAHQHCRGPDCDRPFAWTQAAHNKQKWASDRSTDLNDTLPLCQPCHDLLDNRGWTADLDHRTGDVRWRSPEGRTATNRHRQHRRRGG